MRSKPQRISHREAMHKLEQKLRDEALCARRYECETHDDVDSLREATIINIAMYEITYEGCRSVDCVLNASDARYLRPTATMLQRIARLL